MIDSERLNREIDELAAISEAPAPVVTRVLFSEADLAARLYLKQKAREAGLIIREDAAGNIFLRWPGSEPDLPAIGTGSHIDAIPNAGRYDGVVGVLGGLEAIRSLRAEGFIPRHSIELIVFTAEEPTRFGIGCLGSRLLAGMLTVEKTDALRDNQGRSLDELRLAAGYGKEDLAGVRLANGFYNAFIELHIEQGPVLEAKGLDIGVVEKIAAPATLRLKLTGVGGHAGAVLMLERHDAGLAGAEISLAVERAALESGSPDAVGTTGVFKIAPGAVNSVPFEAWLEIDVRDTDLAARDGALEKIQQATRAICERRGVAWQLEVLNADPPAICAPELVSLVETISREKGFSVQRQISRAYHDSLFMARIAPTTMIFIPCYKGYSHRPDEYSSPQQIARGVAVLEETLRRLAT